MSLVALRYLALDSRSFPIWTNHTIHHEIWSSGKDISKPLDIEWTTLTSALLSISIETKLLSSALGVRVNGNEVARKTFLVPALWDLSIDVMPQLVPGRNIFTVDVTKLPWVGVGDVIVAMSLIIEGEGLEVADPIGPLQWFIDNPIATVGIVLGVAGGILYFWKRKKR